MQLSPTPQARAEARVSPELPAACPVQPLEREVGIGAGTEASPIRVLALDLGGARTGWALGASPGCPAGTWRGPCYRKGESDAVRHARLGDLFAGWLPDLLVEHRPQVCVLERMFFSSREGRGAAALLGLRMLTLTVMRRHEIPVEEVAVASWQAWAKRHFDWQKIKRDDVNDARAMVAWWLAVRAESWAGCA